MPAVSCVEAGWAASGDDWGGVEGWGCGGGLAGGVVGVRVSALLRTEVLR